MDHKVEEGGRTWPLFLDNAFIRCFQGMNNPHDIAVTEDGGSVYVVEIGPNKIWKFRTSK